MTFEYSSFLPIIGLYFLHTQRIFIHGLLKRKTLGAFYFFALCISNRSDRTLSGFLLLGIVCVNYFCTHNLAIMATLNNPYIPIN